MPWGATGMDELATRVAHPRIPASRRGCVAGPTLRGSGPDSGRDRVVVQQLGTGGVERLGLGGDRGATTSPRIDDGRYASAKLAGGVRRRSASQQVVLYARIGCEIEASSSISPREVAEVLAGNRLPARTGGSRVASFAAGAAEGWMPCMNGASQRAGRWSMLEAVASAVGRCP